MPKFAEDRLGDSFTTLSKTGHVIRSPALDQLAPLAEHVMSAFPGEVLYDIYYNGDSLKSLSLTEIFSQGLLINPCCDRMRFRLARMGLDSSDASVSADRILAAGRLDKYRLMKNFDRSPLDAVVFLPGSNLLEQAVDWGRVKRLAADGAMLKLHPITSTPLERRLSLMFPGRVLSRRQSGFDALTRATNVYTTVNSEMGLLAILMGKRVDTVDVIPVPTRPIYRQLYDVVLPESDQKCSLEKLLGSRHAGFYWHWNERIRAVEIVEAIREAEHA